MMKIGPLDEIGLRGHYKRETQLYKLHIVGSRDLNIWNAFV